VVLLKTKFL
jgi:hypothetical protein